MPGLPLPPLAEIYERGESVVGISETALVDDQAGIDLSGFHGRHDLVVGHHPEPLEARSKEAQEKRGRGPAAGDRDGKPAEGARLLRYARSLFGAGHQQWSAAPSQGSP